MRAGRCLWVILHREDRRELHFSPSTRFIIEVYMSNLHIAIGYYEYFLPVELMRQSYDSV